MQSRKRKEELLYSGDLNEHFKNRHCDASVINVVVNKHLQLNLLITPKRTQCKFCERAYITATTQNDHLKKICVGQTQQLPLS